MKLRSPVKCWKWPLVARFWSVWFWFSSHVDIWKQIFDICKPNVWKSEWVCKSKFKTL